MVEPVRQIVYISAARSGFDAEDLQEIFSRSVENNSRAGITGLLLYRDLEFMQVIEGPEPAIEALYARIARDPRHSLVIKLLDQILPEREFPDWAMQVVNLRDRSVSEFAAAGQDLEVADLRSLAGSPSRAKRLLREFRDAARR